VSVIAKAGPAGIGGRFSADRYLPALIVIVAATLLMAPAFWVGHINGHSSFLNVSWSQGFARALFAGEIYPRWLPEMSRGAGSPAFYFYAPLPFYLAAPFHLVAGPRMAVVLVCWLMLALSGLSFLSLSKAFVGSGAALVAAIVYMAMPYHLLADIWIRAAIGEQAAFIFVPLCLLCAYRLDESIGYAFGLAAGFAGLLLSHLPSALAFSPFLVGFCLWTAWRTQPIAVVLRAAFAGLLAGGLASAYIVPAVLLQGMIWPEYWGVNLPRNYFLFAGNDQPFMRFLDGYVLAMGAVVAVASILMAGRDRRALPWVIVIFAVLFLTTSPSWPVWALSPVLDLVQFPWRTLTFFEVAACMLLALALDSQFAKARILLGLMVVVILAMTAICVTGRGRVDAGASLVFRSPAAEDALIAAGADAAEYMPFCRNRDAADRVVDGSSRKIVETILAKAGEGVLPVLYYPFLRVRANGAEVPTACDPQTGLVRVEIAPGANVVVEKAAMPAERAGYAMSIVSLGILLGGLAYARRARRVA
jgi:hypothetical protein